MRGQKGITLIALVITIIVLLILAGITIAMLTGENGILNRSSQARYDNILANVDEQVRLAALSLKTTISSNVAGRAGYIATGSSDSTVETPITGAYKYNSTKASSYSANVDGKKYFSELCLEVANALNVNTATCNDDGYSVTGYLDIQGTDKDDGEGYIYISYSDNSLRAALPTSGNESIVGDDSSTNPLKTSWDANGLGYYRKNLKTSDKVNQATVVYVIKVENYDCSLIGNALMTTQKTVNDDFGVESYKTSTSASSYLK